MAPKSKKRTQRRTAGTETLYVSFAGIGREGERIDRTIVHTQARGIAKRTRGRAVPERSNPDVAVDRFTVTHPWCDACEQRGVATTIRLIGTLPVHLCRTCVVRFDARPAAERAQMDTVGNQLAAMLPSEGER
jgi:hypothetical protein